MHSKERAAAAEAVVRALIRGSKSDHEDCESDVVNSPCTVIQSLQRRILQLEDRLGALEAENRDLKAQRQSDSRSADIVDAMWSMLSDN